MEKVLASFLDAAIQELLDRSISSKLQAALKTLNPKASGGFARLLRIGHLLDCLDLDRF